MITVTLPGLVAVLNDAEFTVVESGADRYPEMSEFRPPAEPDTPDDTDIVVIEITQILNVPNA